MKADQMEYRVEVPEKTTIDIVGGLFTVKGPKGEVKRKFIFPKIQITKEENAVVFRTKKPTKRMTDTILCFIKSKTENLFEYVS